MDGLSMQVLSMLDLLYRNALRETIQRDALDPATAIRSRNSPPKHNLKLIVNFRS